MSGAKGTSELTVADFVPTWWTDEEKEEADKQANLAAKAAQAFGLGGRKGSGR